MSAVCHGPSGLLSIRGEGGERLIAGKRVTGFSDTEESLAGKTDVVPFSLESELVRSGASFESALLPFTSHVVRDGRLITGQNPASAAGVGEAVVEALASGAPRRGTP